MRVAVALWTEVFFDGAFFSVAAAGEVEMTVLLEMADRLEAK